MPEFSLYIPNLQNDGHDTNVEFADAWAGKFIPTLLSNPKFMQDMLDVLTFDESSLSGKNRIYSAFVGNMVKGGVVNHSSLNHYSVMRTVEDNLGLGTLHKNDETATIIDGIWK